MEKTAKIVAKDFIYDKYNKNALVKLDHKTYLYGGNTSTVAPLPWKHNDIREYVFKYYLFGNSSNSYITVWINVKNKNIEDIMDGCSGSNRDNIGELNIYEIIENKR